MVHTVWTYNKGRERASGKETHCTITAKITIQRNKKAVVVMKPLSLAVPDGLASFRCSGQVVQPMRTGRDTAHSYPQP